MVEALLAEFTYEYASEDDIFYVYVWGLHPAFWLAVFHLGFRWAWDDNSHIRIWEV